MGDPVVDGDHRVQGTVLSPAQVSQRVLALISVLTMRAPTGQTPRRLIWSLNKAREYRYEPVLSAKERHRVPLLLVYAPIGRPDILDLCLGHSFVDWMRRHGFDVFLLDWGAPAPWINHLG